METTVTPAIEIRDLRVDYGSFVAVRDISLSIPPGEVYGILGPNGAGKTSTFRVLATLNHPTYGEVRMCGLDLFEETEAARSLMGYMPDLAPVPTDLKAWEFLELYAHGYGLGSARQRKARVAECLEEVNLTDQRDSWCHKLSRGQTQRLVLAKTLLHRPRILILDEPASGMDPLSRRDLRLTLRRMADSGAAVVISSHILSELADMCTSLCVMNKGSILAAGQVDVVRSLLGESSRVLCLTVLPGSAEAAAALLASVPAVEEVTRQGERFSFRFTGELDTQAGLLSSITSAGIAVRSYEEQRASFEDILMQIAASNRHF